MAEWALAYAAATWPVFPLSGKIPFKGSAGFRDASTDPDVVARWWRDHPGANIGTALPAGVVVVDVDGATGAATLRSFAHRLPETLTCVTGRGLHLYFRVKGQVRQGAGILGAGIDTRVSGAGYTVLPPSVHPDTAKVYRWHDPEVAVADLPDWLATRLRPAPPRPRQAVRFDDDGSDRLAGLVRAVATAPEGQRNAILWWAARRATEERADPGAILSRFTEAALSAGLEPREVRLTLASAMKGGGA